MRDYLVLLAILSTVPLTLWRPFYGLMAWCWISYMVPHQWGWGFIRQFPVAKIVGAVLLVRFALSAEPKSIPVNRVTIAYILLIIWMTLSHFIADPSHQASVEFERTIKIHLMTFVTLMMVYNRERLNWILAAICIFIGFYGVKGGFFTVVTGGQHRVQGPPGGFFEGNNELGLTLLLIVPLINYFRLQMTNVWLKRAILAALLLCGLAVIGTYSRGAFLAGAAVIVFLWAKSSHKFASAAGLSIVILLGFTFMPEKWHERMSVGETNVELTEKFEVRDNSWCSQATLWMKSKDASAGGRLNAWCAGLEIAKHNFFGDGFAAYNPANFYLYAPIPEDFHDAHSIYFQMLGEHGFVGLTIFLTLLLFAFLTARKAAKRTRDIPELKWVFDLGSMLQVCFVAYAAGGAFLGMSYFDLYYHLIAFAAILDRISRQELDRVELAEKTTEASVAVKSETPAIKNHFPGLNIP